MFLIIDLKDHENKSHKVIQLEIQAQATIKALKDEIHSKFQIELGFLEIFDCNGRRIDLLVGLLEEAGIKDLDTLILKHSNIDVWVNVVKRATEIKSKDTTDQPKAAQHTLDLIKLLEESKFFLCYYRLLDELERISSETKEYFGGHIGTMEAATRQYFFDWLKSHGNLKESRSFDINFEGKTDGIHSGCIATVCYDGTNDKYFIKTHHMGSTKTSSKSTFPPDLREVFAYLLLEAIGLGPECHFFGPPPGMSKNTLYIATRSIPNLNLMESATQNSPNIRTIILEIHVASSILCLGDVHEQNCGYYDGKSSIFDFNVPPSDDYTMDLLKFKTNKPQCVDTLVNIRQVNQMSAFAQTIDANTRMKVGQNLVQAWKMLECVDAAVKKVTLIKERIRCNGGIIEDTGDLNKYVEGIRHNISLFNK